MGVEDYNKQQMERLKEHKIAFDQEAMWAAMQKKKKRRGALYFFTMALVALAIVFFTYGLFSLYTGENSKYSEGKTSENELSNNINVKSEGKAIDQSNKIANLDSSKNSEIEHSKTGTNDTNISNELSSNTENKATTNSKRSFSNSDNKVSVKENVKSKLTNVYSSKPTDSIKQSANRSITDQNSQSSSFVKTTSIDNPNAQVGQKSNNAEQKTLDNLINIQPLKIYDFPYLESLRDLQIKGEELEINGSPITEVIKESKSRFHIGAYGGVGYLFRQTSGDSTSVLNETLEEISIGLELKYQLTPNFFVRSGVEYWHATERKENSTSSTFNIENIEDLDILPEGLTEADKGIVVISYYSKIHTIYQSYNIPVLFGWNTNNAKWNLFAEAGVLYNFKMEKRRDESLVSGEESRYNVGSQNQISPIAGLGISYNPTNKIELFARSNWRGSQFVTLSETPESLKFGSIRAQLGVRIGI